MPVRRKVVQAVHLVDGLVGTTQNNLSLTPSSVLVGFGAPDRRVVDTAYESVDCS